MRGLEFSCNGYWYYRVVYANYDAAAMSHPHVPGSAVPPPVPVRPPPGQSLWPGHGGHHAAPPTQPQQPRAPAPGLTLPARRPAVKVKNRRMDQTGLLTDQTVTNSESNNSGSLASSSASTHDSGAPDGPTGSVASLASLPWQPSVWDHIEQPSSHGDDDDDDADLEFPSLRQSCTIRTMSK